MSEKESVRNISLIGGVIIGLVGLALICWKVGWVVAFAVFLVWWSISIEHSNSKRFCGKDD